MGKPKSSPESMAISRRGLIGGLVAAGALVLLVKPERPECPRFSDKPGTRWIGHC